MPIKKEAIIEAFDSVIDSVDVVFVTGGLGPTKDDRTKDTLCEYFNQKLIVHEETKEYISTLFLSQNRPLLETNVAQANILEKATAFANKRGTAPGMALSKKGTTFIFFPGIPEEMKYLFMEEVKPYLQEHFTLKKITHRTVIAFGVPESFLAEKIKDWENSLPKNISLAYLPSMFLIKLRLSSFSGEDVEGQIATKIAELKKIIPEHFLGEISLKMEENVVQLLKKQNLTLSVAESCTGGTLSQKLVSLSGVSQAYKGGVTAYSNEAKTALLKVEESLIKEHGAVSQEVAIEMAKGARTVFQTDCSIATTGIVGPNGGTKEKPVGTVWVCIDIKGKINTKCLSLRYDRGKNITFASQTALTFFYHILQSFTNE